MRFIPARTHTIVGFIVGIVLILAPNVFGFSDTGGAAAAVPRIIGLIIVLSELTVKGSFSNMGMVPMKLHLGMDILLGAVLALSPWIFSFSDEGTNATLPHVIVGVMIVGYALVTKTEDSTASASSK